MRFLSNLLASFKIFQNRRVASPLTRRAWLQVECLEGRELMSTNLVPNSLLTYYGYPSLINGAQGNLSQAAATLGSYGDVILGDTLELSTHPDHSNTVKILANPALAHTTVFGYIDLGVSTQDLSIGQIESRIDQWKQTGAKGIFLDDFGYDFNTTRARQNTVVQYAHSDGLVVVANAWVPADAFGAKIDPVHNPSGTKTALNAGDFYMYESYQVSVGSYVSAADWQTKAKALATYQAAIGFHVLATTTNNAANVFNQSEFNYAWYSALLAGYSAVGWGEYDFASVTCQAPLRTPPAVNPGTRFTSGMVETGAVFAHNTNLGQVQVNTTTHIGSFTALPAAPVFTAKAVSETQINFSWATVASATGYVVDEWVAGLWEPIANLGTGSTSFAVTGLKHGTTYLFRVGAANAAGTTFANFKSVATLL